jgi:hypothetical protein
VIPAAEKSSSFSILLLLSQEPGIHLAFRDTTYYIDHVTALASRRLKMTRLQKIWATLFTLAVTCSLLFSSVAFALNDPK